jgi:hypothetical protein
MYLCTLGMVRRKEFITNNPNPAMPGPRKQVLCSKLSCIPMCINHSVYTNVGGNNLCWRQALLAHWRREMGLEDDKCRRIMESLAKSSLNIHETSFRGLNVCLQLFFFFCFIELIYEVTRLFMSPSISIIHRGDVDPILVSSVFKVILRINTSLWLCV